MNEHLRKHHVGTSPRHAYYIFTRCGFFYAEFQPINQKTGKPWQALRSITTGADRCVLNNWDTKAECILEQGNVPADWQKFNGGAYTGANGGLFSTRQLALAAIEAHICVANRAKAKK